MSNDVRKKFNEAVFFFKHVQNSFESMSSSCDYFVSAFLSAARSVSFIIQAEHKDWWDKNYPSLTGNFSKFNDLRVISVHRKTVGVFHSIKTEFPGGLTLGAGETATIPISFQPGSRQPIKGTIKGRIEKTVLGVQKRELTIREYSKDKKKDVRFENFIDEASQYLTQLGQIVDKYETTFVSSEE